MQAAIRAAALLSTLSLFACAGGADTSPRTAPRSGLQEAPLEVGVETLELEVDGRVESASGLVLELRTEATRRRPRRGDLVDYVLSVRRGDQAVESLGNNEAFYDEVPAWGHLVTAAGWTGSGALRLRVAEALRRSPLSEDAAAEVAEAEALRLGHPRDAGEVSWELTPGEGALVWSLFDEDGKRLLRRIYVGLHSGQVIAAEPAE